MSSVSPEDVRLVIADYLTEQSNGTAQYGAEDLPDETDLLLDGHIDSLGLLNLVGFLQERFGEAIDFEEIEPDDMTIVGPICRFVAAQATG